MGITPFRAIPPLTERDQRRFWSKVQKSDACWRWTGTIRRDTGYGFFAVSFDTHAGASH